MNLFLLFVILQTVNELSYMKLMKKVVVGDCYIKS